MGNSFRVCPECGHDTFTATATTSTEYTIEVGPNGELYEIEAEIMESGMRDIETLQCTDCCEEWDPASLITEQAYTDSLGEYDDA